jgi:hypothetical protein
MVYSFGITPPNYILEPYNIGSNIHNDYYEAMCDLMSNEVPRCKVERYKSDYDLLDGYIQFENSHLSGERIDGYLNSYTNQKIQIVEFGYDIPVMSYGNRYEFCSDPCTTFYRIENSATNCSECIKNPLAVNVDIKLGFKPITDGVIFEIIANNQTQQFKINKG